MKIIDALEVDEFGKRLGPDGGLLALVVECPIDMKAARNNGDIRAILAAIGLIPSEVEHAVGSLSQEELNRLMSKP
jgi:hypothetical protein